MTVGIGPLFVFPVDTGTQDVSTRPMHTAGQRSGEGLVDVGMKDETCPSRTVMPVFERIPGPKAIHVYPDLAHSPCTDFNAHAMSWLRRYLGA